MAEPTFSLGSEPTYLKAAPPDPIRDYSESLRQMLAGFGGFAKQPGEAVSTSRKIGEYATLPVSLLSIMGVPAKGEGINKIQALARAAKSGSQSAKDELLASMEKILWSVANRYGRSERTGAVRGEPGIKQVEGQVSARDLYNRGAEEILKLIPKYEEQSSQRNFVGYTYPNMVRAMKNEALGAKTPIAISPDILSAMRKMDRAEQKLRTRLGPYADISTEQLAKEAGLKPDIVARIQSGNIQSAPTAQSLEQMRQATPDAFWQSLANQMPGTERFQAQTEQPGARIAAQESFGQLRDLFRSLPANIKNILEQSEGRSSKDAAESLGIPLRTYQRQLKQAQDMWQQAVIRHKGISGGSDKPTKAEFRFFQQGYGPVPGSNQYDLTSDIIDPKTGRVLHTPGSTVSESVLKEHGVPYDPFPHPLIPDKMQPPTKSVGAAAGSGKDPFREQPIWDPENLKPLIKPTTRPFDIRIRFNRDPHDFLSSQEALGTFTDQMPHKPVMTPYPMEMFHQEVPEGPALGHNPDALRHGELIQRLRSVLDAAKMSSGRN